MESSGLGRRFGDSFLHRHCVTGWGNLHDSRLTGFLRCDRSCERDDVHIHGDGDQFCRHGSRFSTFARSEHRHHGLLSEEWIWDSHDGLFGGVSSSFGHDGCAGECDGHLGQHSVVAECERGNIRAVMDWKDGAGFRGSRDLSRPVCRCESGIQNPRGIQSHAPALKKRLKF